MEILVINANSMVWRIASATLMYKLVDSHLITFIRPCHTDAMFHSCPKCGSRFYCSSSSKFDGLNDMFRTNTYIWLLYDL